jgi:hypothetical protein
MGATPANPSPWGSLGNTRQIERGRTLAPSALYDLSTRTPENIGCNCALEEPRVGGVSIGRRIFPWLLDLAVNDPRSFPVPGRSAATTAIRFEGCIVMPET